MKAPRWRSIIDLDMYAGTLAFLLVFSAITLWGTTVFVPLDWLVLGGSHVATASQLLAVLFLLNAAIVTAIILRLGLRPREINLDVMRRSREVDPGVFSL